MYMLCKTMVKDSPAVNNQCFFFFSHARRTRLQHFIVYRFQPVEGSILGCTVILMQSRKWNKPLMVLVFCLFCPPSGLMSKVVEVINYSGIIADFVTAASSPAEQRRAPRALIEDTSSLRI